MASHNRLQRALHHLYYGDSATSRGFRYGLLVFDIVTVGFFVVSSIVEPTRTLIAIDLTLAALLSLDFLFRMAAATSARAFWPRWVTLIDLAVIFSLLAPALIQNVAFLRVVRMLRLLRSEHLLRQLRSSSRWFRRNEEVVQSTINLAVFIFITTSIVFLLEASRNEHINNYFDALYFTVSVLTTTGFGDITLDDTVGRMFTVGVMVFGVALFLRLLQTIFRPPKVTVTCHACGLTKHDPDAVHCKHCGATINIPTEGDWR